VPTPVRRGKHPPRCPLSRDARTDRPSIPAARAGAAGRERSWEERLRAVSREWSSESLPREQKVDFYALLEILLAARRKKNTRTSSASPVRRADARALPAASARPRFDRRGRGRMEPPEGLPTSGRQAGGICRSAEDKARCHGAGGGLLSGVLSQPRKQTELRRNTLSDGSNKRATRAGASIGRRYPSHEKKETGSWTRALGRR